MVGVQAHVSSSDVDDKDLRLHGLDNGQAAPSQLRRIDAPSATPRADRRNLLPRMPQHPSPARNGKLEILQAEVEGLRQAVREFAAQINQQKNLRRRETYRLHRIHCEHCSRRHLAQTRTLTTREREHKA